MTLEDYNANDFAEMSNKENPEKIAGFKLQYHKRQIKKKIILQIHYTDSLIIQ